MTDQHPDHDEPFTSWDMINELQPELDQLAVALNVPRGEPLPEDTPAVALAFVHAVQRMRDNRGLDWPLAAALAVVQSACTVTAMTSYAKAVRITIRVYEKWCTEMAGLN
jgi:hypothetical protein